MSHIGRLSRSINWRPIRFWTLIAAFAALVIWFVTLVVHDTKLNNATNELPKTIYVQDFGTITDLSSCSSHKHSYDCWATFDNGKQYNVDLTDYPDGFWYPGTVMHHEIITQGDRQRTLICNTQVCMEQGTFWRGDEDFSEKFAQGNR